MRIAISDDMSGITTFPIDGSELNVGLIVILWTIGIGTVAVLMARMLRCYWRLRTPHIVTCPETGCTAAISVDPLKASGLQGSRVLQVVSCSRWPEREECHQSCLRAFLAELDANRRSSLSEWYRGKHCALCGSRFGKVAQVWDLPAPLDDRGISHQWADVQDVAEMLPHSQPICWQCQLADMMKRTRDTAASPAPAAQDTRV